MKLLFEFIFDHHRPGLEFTISDGQTQLKTKTMLFDFSSRIDRPHSLTIEHDGGITVVPTPSGCMITATITGPEETENGG